MRNSLARILSTIVMFVACATTHAAVETVVGKPAPAFELPVLGSESRHIALESQRGKVVLLDFWASWCGPCRQSFPLYEKLHGELPAQDFTLLAINLDEMADGPAAFLFEHPVSYTSLADPAGDVAKKFGLVGMPTSFVIDRDGIVHSRHTGFKPQDIDALRSEIRGLIAGSTDGRQADAH
ncbi:MAG TPA: TlpA disulfide reductase family protein [Rudaea sp.]|nr:TlpA disulfide reductase family protein [Rudaea sp.]